MSNFPEQQKDIHFFIHNSAHAGDVILTRPLINELREKFPEVKITLECIAKNKYLWADFNLPVLAYEDPRIYGANNTNWYSSFLAPTPNCPQEAFFLNMWLASYPPAFALWDFSYATLLHTFNTYMHHYQLSHLFQLPLSRKPPLVEFYAPPVVPFEVRDNSVLVENGPIFSAQSYLELNDYLEEFAEEFPDLNFYCSAPVKFTAPNIIDCSSLNLVELSELSNSCLAFLMRASGVNAASLTEANRYKPRCIAGWTVPKRAPGNIPENPLAMAVTKEEIRQFLTAVAKQKEAIKNFLFFMAENPGFDPTPSFESEVLQNSGNRFCKFLRSRTEIDKCSAYLNKILLAAQPLDYKNWETAHIVSDLSDGNLLDMGNAESCILKNALLKGIPGAKYCIDLRSPAAHLPAVGYLIGDILAVPLPDAYFQNITCLSVLEHEVELPRFAQEVSRLLKDGGRVYVTFDYWEPKLDTTLLKIFDVTWNIFAKDDVLKLIAACKKEGLYLVEDIDWTLGDAVIDANYHSPVKELAYTFGMLVFEKKSN
jgi:SAM-dependent methyltransferase